MPRVCHPYKSHSQSGKLGWVKGSVTRFPSFPAVYLFDNHFDGDDSNFVRLGVSAKKSDRWYAGGGENLLSVDGLHWFLPNVIKNFSGFAPLGAILALVLGAGLAERVGLLPALMV